MSKFLAGLRPFIPVYGATADTGQTDDPLTDSTAYSSGTVYSEGALVSSAGVYYYSRSNSNLGNAVSNNVYWFQIAKFYYVDSATGNDANTGSTDPATAFAAPLQTLVRINDYLHTGGSFTAPANSMILFKRGQTFYGNITADIVSIIGAYGSRTSARPILAYNNNTDAIFIGSVILCNVATIIRNLKLTSQYVTHFVTTGANTLLDGDLVTRQSDGLLEATVVGTPTNNRICLAYTTKSDASTTVASNTVFQTSGGVRSCTLTSGSVLKTVVDCLTAVADDIRVNNCDMYNSVGNGVSCGTTNVRGSADRFYIKNCFIHDTSKWGSNGAGLQGGWGTGIKILSNTSYDNGVNNTGSHNFYLDDLDSCEFANNWSYMTGAYGNHGLVVHGQCDALDIHDNLFEASQSGIGLNDGYAGAWAENYTNCNVYRNIIRNCGLYNGTGLILDIAANSNCKYYNNLAYNNKGVIVVKPYNTAGNTTTANLVIAYNTFISDATIGAGDYFFKINATGVVAITSATIENNIIESKLTNLATFSTDANTPAVNITFNNNLIYNTTGYTSVMRWVGTGYTLANWVSTAPNANSTNATTASYASVYINEAGGDLTLQGGSPAKAVATYITSVLRDFKQVNRSVSTPSAGAYE